MLYVICIKENKKKPQFKVGVKYQITNADMYEYATDIDEEEVWFDKCDEEHFDYHC